MATNPSSTAIARLAALAVVVALGVAGCSDSGDEVTTDSSATTAESADTTEVEDTTTTAEIESSTTAAPTTADTTPSTSTPVPDTLLLTPDGVGDFVFGNPQSAVVDAMTALLGPPVETRPVECPSGSDTIVTYQGAYFIFGADTFAGWAWGGAEDPPIVGATTEGITLGSTVAEAQAAFGPDFAFQPDSTLGDEFYIGTDYPSIGGFTTGPDPDDTISRLYGGDLCAFR